MTVLPTHTLSKDSPTFFPQRTPPSKIIFHIPMNPYLWKALQAEKAQFNYCAAASSGGGAPSLLRLHDHILLDIPHSVGLLWTSDQPVAETSKWQHSKETDIHADSGIRTRNPNKRTVADQLLRPRVHWDRHCEITVKKFYFIYRYIFHLFIIIYIYIYDSLHCK
jgi:hypothetical protein